MAEDRVRALEALLTEAQAAHHVFERTELGGVYDEDWPRWYAGHLVTHGIGEVLGRPVGVTELAGLLTTTAADGQDAEPWATQTARRLSAELRP